MSYGRTTLGLWVVLAMSGCILPRELGLRHYAGRVVDSETRIPLEGASVIPFTYTNVPGRLERLDQGPTILTDSQGFFRFDFHEGYPRCGYVTLRLKIEKEGYLPYWGKPNLSSEQVEVESALDGVPVYLLPRAPVAE